MSVWSCLVDSYKLIETLPEANDLKDPKNYLLKDGLCTNNATINVTINLDGEFVTADLIPKSEQMTIIPCTPKSVQRTAGNDPHPIFDKLQYIAVDWSFVLDDTSKDYKDCFDKYVAYRELLGKWAEITQYESVKAVYKYITNGHIIHDILNTIPLNSLVKNTDTTEENESVVAVSEESENVEESENIELLSNTNIVVDIEKAKKNFKTLKDVFVRFKVLQPDRLSELWLDDDVYEEWSKKYRSIYDTGEQETVLSYISGEIEDSSSFFPKKVRNQGDGARLMSSNDDTFVTFGDRFTPKNYNQASPVGSLSMQKSLYALSWLISNQGFSSDGFIVLTWNNDNPNNMKEPNMFDARKCFYMDNVEYNKGDFAMESNKVVTALMRFGQRGASINDYTGGHKVNVLVLDGDSKGRIAVQYYNQFDSELYYRKLENWFKTCRWLYYDWQEIRGNDGKLHKVKNLPLVKTPLFDTIFNVAYKDCSKGGGESAKKFKKKFYKDILDCIINGKVNKMIAKKSFHIVCNNNSFFSGDEKYLTSRNKWLDAIATTCALFNNLYDLGGYMELNLQEKDRSYCFGRLLSILEKIERTSVSDRATNAERLFNHFSMKPASTFYTIRNSCQVYLVKMKGTGKAGLAVYYEKQIADILALINEGDFDDRPLDEKFLLGYYAQNYSKNNVEQDAVNENENIED